MHSLRLPTVNLHAISHFAETQPFGVARQSFCEVNEPNNFVVALAYTSLSGGGSAYGSAYGSATKTWGHQPHVG